MRLTRPIAPWMKDPNIVSYRQKLELSRIKSRDSKNPKEHKNYPRVKKQYKKTSKDKKNSFFREALSSKPYEILLIVYSINNKKNKS